MTPRNFPGRQLRRRLLARKRADPNSPSFTLAPTDIRIRIGATARIVNKGETA